jgi:hypothetical protein
MGSTWSGLVCDLFHFFVFVGDLGGRLIGTVIILIAAEILVAAINIVVDLYAGVE